MIQFSTVFNAKGTCQNVLVIFCLFLSDMKGEIILNGSLLEELPFHQPHVLTSDSESRCLSWEPVFSLYFLVALKLKGCDCSSCYFLEILCVRDHYLLFLCVSHTTLTAAQKFVLKFFCVWGFESLLCIKSSLLFFFISFSWLECSDKLLFFCFRKETNKLFCKISYFLTFTMWQELEKFVWYWHTLSLKTIANLLQFSSETNWKCCSRFYYMTTHFESHLSRCISLFKVSRTLLRKT